MAEDQTTTTGGVVPGTPDNSALQMALDALTNSVTTGLNTFKLYMNGTMTQEEFQKYWNDENARVQAAEDAFTQAMRGTSTP